MKIPKLKKDEYGYYKAKKKLRILERDNFKCVGCKENDMEVLTIDHVVPKSIMKKLGYNGFIYNQDKNLQVYCLNCQAKKRDKITKKVEKLYSDYKHASKYKGKI